MSCGTAHQKIIFLVAWERFSILIFAPLSRFFVILSVAKDLSMQAEMALTFLSKNAFLVAQRQEDFFSFLLSPQSTVLNVSR